MRWAHLPVLLLWSLLALWARPAAAERDGSVRLWLGAGYDSNPARETEETCASAQNPPVGDLFLSGAAAASGRWSGERFSLSGSYDAGGKKFALLPSEDTLVQAAAFDGTALLGERLALGLSGRGKDRRGASQRYTDLAGSAFAELTLTPDADLRLEGGARRFLYPLRYELSFGAAEAGLTGRYRLDRRKSLFAFAQGSFRTYAAQVEPAGEAAAEAPVRRRDVVASAGVGFQYRGPFSAGLTYSFVSQRSNALRAAILRHRLDANGGVRLPWKWMLLAQAALQLTRYPEGMDITEDLSITRDDESLNSLNIRLVRPLGEHVDLELRYALYVANLPQNCLFYLRQTGTLGLSVRF